MKSSQKGLALRRSGFTLIELLVVIAVIGILAAVILASLNTARAKARDAKRIADLKQVQTALELYRNDNSDYPSYITTTEALWITKIKTDLVDKGYLGAVPLDPGGDYYRYFSDYSSGTGCNGLDYNTWEYVILLNTETNPSGVFPSTHANQKKCIPGPLK